MKLVGLFRFRSLKAQVELFAVLGIIIIVVAVAYYSHQSGLLGIPPIISISESQKLVKESVENFITSGALEKLREISESGGMNGNSVKFLDKDVSYWSYAGIVSVPDIKSTLQAELKEYLSENRGFLEESFGKNVSISEPSVWINILDERIDISVNMPTSVNGRPIPQPYRISILSNFGKAYDFSKKFVEAQNRNRFLETFTLANIIISPLENGVRKVPISINLFECGEFVYRSWEDIKPEMEALIKSTLANIYTFGESPKGTFDKSPFAEFEIPMLDGKLYSGIDVSFHEEDKFELDRASFEFTPEPIMVLAKPIPLTDMCSSEPVYIKYYLRYPVVVRVKDEVTGIILQFAVDVYIKDNQPGNFGAGYELEAGICSNPLCSVKLSITDLAGNPVSGASVSFLGCEIGKTGLDGMVEGKAVCGAGNLRIYKEGYGMYEATYSVDNLENISVSIAKKPVLNVYVHVVNIQKETDGYVVLQDGITDLSDWKMIAQLEFVPTGGNRCDDGICTRIFKETTKSLTNIPAGEYTIVGGILSPNFGTLYGVVLSSYSIKEEYDGNPIHVYLPYNPYDFSYGISDIENSKMDLLEKADRMYNLLKKCGIEPVTETPIDPDGFSCPKVSLDEL